MIDNILGYEIYSLEDLVFVIGFPSSIVLACIFGIVLIVKLNQIRNEIKRLK
jgi:uncharacterized membrane protein YciS (DUF1049 family)